MARDDISTAERYVDQIELDDLPLERRIRYLFDKATVAVQRQDTDRAIATMLEAETLAPEQVHTHMMAQQIVGYLRNSKSGRQDPRLAQLEQRTRRTKAAAATGT